MATVKFVLYKSNKRKDGSYPVCLRVSKKGKLADAVREMELRDIVLETDCPYLTPAPHRGERNESAYVRYVCEKVAELKGLTPGETAEATTANAERIFGK